MPALPAKQTEIDLSGVPSTLRRHVSPSLIVQAVRIWAKFGTPVEISKYLGVSPQTAVAYTKEPWWAEVAKQLQGALDLDVQQSFQRLGTRAIAQLEDRLTYGDFYINRMGERARRPLTVKELTDIAKLAFDKSKEARVHLEGRGTGDEEGEKKTDLEKLADLLRSAALRTAQAGGVIDVTPTPLPTPDSTQPSSFHPASNVIPFNSGQST